MIERFRRAGLVWPTVWLLPALALLLWLGTWQWQRHLWKADLIRQIETRTRAPAVPLGAALARAAGGQSVEYVRVRVEGRFDHGSESFLYMPERQGPGYHLYTHFETTLSQRVIVNRGFIPEARKAQTTRAESLTAGTTTVTGLLRTPQSPGWFTPPSELAKRLFFYPDHAGMLAVVPMPAETRQAAVPFFIDADAVPGVAAYPRGGVTRLELPNRHLEYALTWWALALTLAAVHVAFARGRLQASQRNRDHGAEAAE